MYKGGGSSAEKFRTISQQVSSIAVLDQEVSPALKVMTTLERGLWKVAFNMSRLYYVGPQAKETAIKCLEGVDPDIVQAFGWPRVDYGCLPNIIFQMMLLRKFMLSSEMASFSFPLTLVLTRKDYWNAHFA